MDTVISITTVSVTKLKRTYANILKQADDSPTSAGVTICSAFP